VDSFSDKNEATESLNPFRQFLPTLRRASVDDIDLVSATYPFRIFALRSDRRLAGVLAPGYFDDLTDVGLRKHDEIKVAANYGGVGEYATLVVDEVKQGRASETANLKTTVPAKPRIAGPKAAQSTEEIRPPLRKRFDAARSAMRASGGKERGLPD